MQLDKFCCCKIFNRHIEIINGRLIEENMAETNNTLMEKGPFVVKALFHQTPQEEEMRIT